MPKPAPKTQAYADWQRINDIFEARQLAARAAADGLPVETQAQQEAERKAKFNAWWKSLENAPAPTPEQAWREARDLEQEEKSDHGEGWTK